MVNPAFQPDIPEDQNQDQFGGPLAQGQGEAFEEKSGAAFIKEDKEAAVEKKKFNRSRMGGFLMELGLNVLSSNRDDAGAAVGDAFGKTRSDRDTRKRTEAADSLAKSEREREIRRQDESDTFKREKAARDERKEDRDIDAAKLNKLDRLQHDDGTYEYVDKKLGRVYSKTGGYLRGSTKGDKKDALTMGQERVERRHASDRLDDMVESMKEFADTETEKAIGNDPTDAEVTEYALSRLSARDRALLSKQSKTEDYKTRNWDE